MLDNLLRPDPDQILQVSALTRQIKTLLEGSFTDLWVRGEVSNLRRQSSGHVYFSLKDSRSQLPCVLFSRDAAQQNFELEDGMDVLLYGALSIYEPHGRYQLIAKIAIESGQGRLQIEFERLKRKLHAEGLFDADRKKDLPILPRRIAVVTSPTGAALQDFLRILKRRNYRGSVVIFPCRVQGKGAAEEIAGMLQQAGKSRDFDLAVITRGGGSIEDLWAFNHEILARAVADCPLPVISAVGHEIDTVLTDYVADQRAETPSGAAELISSLYLETLERIDALKERLSQSTAYALQNAIQSIRELELRFQLIAPDRVIADLSIRLDDQENRLKTALSARLRIETAKVARIGQNLSSHHPRNHILLARARVEEHAGRLQRATKVALEKRRSRLSQLHKRFDNNGINATLRRGYSILKTREGELIEETRGRQKGDQLTAQLRDGNLDVEVKYVNKTSINT
ncbi:MAG: exodeoxyribonuclease VII large subunit [Verrucomicrobiota bacterium]